MLGTRTETYSDPAFFNHLAGGILWRRGGGALPSGDSNT